MPEIHEVATLTSKGQITLPKPIRQALGVDTGGKVAFDLRGGEVIVTRADEHEDPAIGAFLGAAAVYLVYRDGLVAAGMPNVWSTGPGAVYDTVFFGADKAGAAGTSYSMLTAIIAELFGAFMDDARLLPPQYQQMARDDKPRAIADYIAGMTDRYAMREHRRLFAVGEI